jgi:hypothetical protein
MLILKAQQISWISEQGNTSKDETINDNVLYEQWIVFFFFRMVSFAKLCDLVFNFNLGIAQFNPQSEKKENFINKQSPVHKNRITSNIIQIIAVKQISVHS